MDQKRLVKSVELLALAIALAACAGQATPAAPLVRDNLMYSRQPEVRFLTANTTSPVLVGSGTRQPIAQGDAVTVDDRGQARVRFSDFLVIDVYRNTEVRDIRYTASVDPSAPKAFSVKLKGGSAFSNLNTQKIADQRVRPELRIDTDWAVVKALGTVFWMNYDPDTEVTWVVVKESEVSVAGAGEEVIVHAGEQTWVEPGKPPVDPIPACRNLIGDRFPLIDELTNGALPDIELLCREGTLSSVAGATATVVTDTPTFRPTPTPTLLPDQPATSTSTAIGRPTLTPTATPRPTLTPTATPRPTLTPTSTPTSSPTVVPIAKPFVAFGANPTVVPVCRTSSISWTTDNVREVTYQGSGVTGNEARQEFIQELGGNTFNLEVVSLDGQAERFSTTVIGDVAPPDSSLRQSIVDELWITSEIVIAYFGQNPYRCVGSTAIPAIVQDDLSSTQVSHQQIDDPATVFSVWLQAGDVPSFLVLAYPPEIIASLDPIISNWPYGAHLYAWDPDSDSLRLLQYRTGPPPAPDLVIASFKTTGPTQFAYGGYELPVRVGVVNQGNADAVRFKVSIDYGTDQISSGVPFTVPDQSDTVYPYTAGPLAPGESAVFQGVITFVNLSGLNCEPLMLLATADSCSGDDFMPSTCRVAESDEGNNESAPLIMPYLFCIE